MQATNVGQAAISLAGLKLKGMDCTGTDRVSLITDGVCRELHTMCRWTAAVRPFKGPSTVSQEP